MVVEMVELVLFFLLVLLLPLIELSLDLLVDIGLDELFGFFIQLLFLDLLLSRLFAQFVQQSGILHDELSRIRRIIVE